MTELVKDAAQPNGDLRWVGGPSFISWTAGDREMAMIPHAWEMGGPDMRACMRCPAIQRRQVYGWPSVDNLRFGPWHPVDQFCDLGAAARRLADIGKGAGYAQIRSRWLLGLRYDIYAVGRREDDEPWWVATFRHRALAERFCAAMGWEIVP